MKEFLTTKDVAERYDVPVETVRKWRNDGTGPRGARFGRHVRYPLGELERWERELLDTDPSAA
jgi:excisionase family DNA binding protein